MKCQVIAILALFVVASFAINTEKEYQNEFTKFMQKHQKSYHAGEFKARYEIFKSNLRFIAAQNQKESTFTVAMNQFGDLTNEEFRKFYLGVSAPKQVQQIVSEPEAIRADAPASLDWREKNAVTAVKNQGQCGSCWSFSTTGSTEGCHAISTGKLVALSEQNLMDCSTSQGNQGCNGGLMTQAMDYIISNGGLDTEASYPYTAADGTSCNYKAANSGATLKSYKNVASGDENSLLNTAVSGPVSVAIDASQNSFQFYSGGVYYEPACSSQQLDHGVLVVGYGADAGTDYWWVKNSWGESWGLSGYIKMSRNRSNNCGIATMATLPSC